MLILHARINVYAHYIITNTLSYILHKQQLHNSKTSELQINGETVNVLTSTSFREIIVQEKKEKGIPTSLATEIRTPPTIEPFLISQHSSILLSLGTVGS